MLFEGRRHTVPSSRYGIALDVMLETGWTWQELNDAPADLVDELAILISERARAQKRMVERR